jgi:hypothetical protein
MKILSLLIFCIFWKFAFSQTFSFQMYFEDATGAKDTLEFGYDASASDSIDASFQEINVISQPWSSQFEARITVLNPPNAWDYDEFMSVQEIGHLKKQIKKEDCFDQSLHISMIQLKNAVYPITVTWDNSLFNDPCRTNSIITDWHPVGWFDAILGETMPQIPVELKNSDTASFSYTSIHNINSNQDTLDVLFFALGNQNQVFVGLEELETDLSVYPNPASEALTISLPENASTTDCILFDNLGKEVKRFTVSGDEHVLDVSVLKKGIYLLKIGGETQKISIE